MEKNKNLICRILMLCATVFFAYDVSAQTIKGHVEEASGVEIIGASIMEKGTTNGTVTDIDGNFQLNCKPGAKLVISYVGFTTQEVAAVDGMKVVLQEDNTTLNEVVVIGYGSLAKKEISSSVVQINKDQFNQGAVQDPMGLVAGKVAGLNVSTTNEANPNAMSDIQVRGAGSLKASNGPLIVIDGIAGGDLRNVASQDVESITVLKDASSAAIYGTRGANGVILVTTKKGASGEGVTNVTYDSYIALNFAKPHFKMLSSEEYRRSRRGVDFGYDTDWYDLISRKTSYSLNQYVSLDGSHKNGYYSASLNYKKGNGLDIASGREEYGGRFVVEQRALNKLLTFNTSLSARRVHEDWGNDGMFYRALTVNPTTPVYNEDGSFYKHTDGTGATNPLSALTLINNKGDRTYILGNADVKLQILRNEHHNLNTSLSYALQYNDLKSHYYAPSTADEAFIDKYAGSANIKYDKWWTNRLEWLGNYILSLKDHELKAMIGYSWERSKYEGHYLEDKDFIYDELDYFNIGKGTYNTDGLAKPWASKTESILIGFFGRLNYNWRDMLFASASLRHEGNTRFGKDRKWGNFPAASIAWEITRTPGWESLAESFQSLKPRISYGVTGRSDFDLYQSLNSYSARTDLAYKMGDTWVTGYAPSVNANPELGWEKASSFNIGVDVVAINGRLRGSLEYFDRRSQDLLWTYTAPQPPFIYKNILVNVGTTKNTGIELSADFDVFNKKPFTWTTGINYSYGTTKMTKLSSDIYQTSYIDLYDNGAISNKEYYFRVEEGGKVGQFYGYEYVGLDENGIMMVNNKDGEPILITNATAEDKKYIGNGAPKHFLSWTNSLTYKNFDLTFLFRGAFGFKIYNKSQQDLGLIKSGGYMLNVLRDAYLDNKAIKEDGGHICSYYLENGSYFKLDNVTLGYTFTPKNRHLLESLRVYLTAKNLFTITGYKGHDPSTVPQNGITPGVDESGAYPQATQVSLGLTVKFH